NIIFINVMWLAIFELAKYSDMYFIDTEFLDDNFDLTESLRYRYIDDDYVRTIIQDPHKDMFTYIKDNYPIIEEIMYHNDIDIKDAIRKLIPAYLFYMKHPNLDIVDTMDRFYNFDPKTIISYDVKCNDSILHDYINHYNKSVVYYEIYTNDLLNNLELKVELIAIYTSKVIIQEGYISEYSITVYESEITDESLRKYILVGYEYNHTYEQNMIIEMNKISG